MYILVQNVNSGEFFIAEEKSMHQKVESKSHGNRLLPVLNSVFTPIQQSLLPPPKIEVLTDTVDEKFYFERHKQELVEIYNDYPRKIGKSQGLTQIYNQLKKSKDRAKLVNDFRDAVILFADECKRNKVEKQYIPHFSTFCSRWQDYLEELRSNKPKDLTTFTRRHYTVNV